MAVKIDHVTPVRSVQARQLGQAALDHRPKRGAICDHRRPERIPQPNIEPIGSNVRERHSNRTHIIETGVIVVVLPKRLIDIAGRVGYAAPDHESCSSHLAGHTPTTLTVVEALESATTRRTNRFCLEQILIRAALQHFPFGLRGVRVFDTDPQVRRIKYMLKRVRYIQDALSECSSSRDVRRSAAG